jgi:hypothetical protein
MVSQHRTWSLRRERYHRRNFLCTPQKLGVRLMSMLIGFIAVLVTLTASHV